MRVARAEGKAEVVAERRLDEVDQFAAEIDHMAERLAEGRRPRTPGEEGLQDHRLMEAIYESAREGRPVRLDAVPGLDTTRGPALP
jgi:predicted dehydrogenase